jgi:hypothetical protein
MWIGGAGTGASGGTTTGTGTTGAAGTGGAAGTAGAAGIGGAAGGGAATGGFNGLGAATGIGALICDFGADASTGAGAGACGVGTIRLWLGLGSNATVVRMPIASAISSATTALMATTAIPLPTSSAGLRRGSLSSRSPRSDVSMTTVGTSASSSGTAP